MGKCKSESAVSCEFSPDGQTIMTGVLNPRLRVDNELRVRINIYKFLLFKRINEILSIIKYLNSI